jgi:putative flippase GtrA
VLLATNVVSTALGTVIRFVCYRRWVFVATSGPAVQDAGMTRPLVLHPQHR